MQQYGNIKSIKVRRDRYGYEINERQKERQKKQSVKLIKRQNGMLRYIKIDTQK